MASGVPAVGAVLARRFIRMQGATHGRPRTDTLDAISVASPPGAIHVRSRSDRLWTVAFEITSRESGKTYLTSHPAAGAKSVYLSVSVLRERACLGDVTRALPFGPR